jgi:hypothetical protein
MWDEQHQREFDELRRREYAGILTGAERNRLDDLSNILDAAERATLLSAINQAREEQRRLRRKEKQLRGQNIALAELAGRYDALLERARTALENLRRERDALRSDYERALR